jgi:hypothetical protein
MDRVIRLALEGKPTGWFSPAYKFLADAWRALTQTPQPVTEQKSES